MLTKPITRGDATLPLLPQLSDPLFTTNRQAGRSSLGMHIVYNTVKQKLRGKKCT